MTDLTQHGYSHNQIMELLKSDAWIRGMRYRVDILEGNIRTRAAEYVSLSLEMGGSSEVKHYGRLTMKATDLDYQNIAIQPVMFIEHGGHLFEFFFVPLIPTVVTTRIEGGATYHDIEAYDKTVQLQENSVGSVLFFPRGTVYAAAVERLLDAARVRLRDIEPSTQVMTTDREDWDEGGYYLSVINELLGEIGYNTLTIDNMGVAYASKYQDPALTSASIRYAADSRSVIHLNKTIETDGYKHPNRFVGVVSNADAEPMRYEFTNTDPSSPTSTISTGYVRTEVLKYDNIADLATLRDNVHRRAQEVSISYEYAELKTLIMPFHGVNDIVCVSSNGINGVYEETGWKIDNFSPTGSMTHSLRRVVNV